MLPGDLTGIKMQGLPFQIKNEEVNVFFAEYNIIPNSVYFERNADGRRTGNGVVLFDSPEICYKAMTEM